MKLTTDQVKHTAKLAQLNLTNEEIKEFRRDLSAILGYVDLLNEVATSAVEPTFQTTGLRNVLRLDDVRKEECLRQDQVLSNAPRTKDGYVKTKPVL